MDHLLRSFVSKVHSHAHHSPHDVASSDAMRQLLPMIHCNSPKDVLEMTISVMHEAAQQNAKGFVECGGVATIVNLIITCPYLLLSLEARCQAVRLLRTSSETLVEQVEVLSSVCIQALMTWYTTLGEAGSADMFWMLDTLTSTPSTREKILDESPTVGSLLPLLTSTVLDDPDLCILAMRVFSNLVSTDLSGGTFWGDGGIFLIVALATHRTQDVVGTEQQLLHAVCHLAERAPRSTNEAFRDSCNQHVMKALLMDMREQGIAGMLPVFKITHMFRHLRNDDQFSTMLMHKIVEEFPSLSVDTLHVALDALAHTVTPTSASVVTIDALLHLVRDVDELLVDVSHVILNAIHTNKLASFLPMLIHSCSVDKSLDTALDNNVAKLFDTLVENPTMVLHPIQIHGNPPHVLFHILEDLVGDAYPMTSSGVTSWTDHCITAYIRERLEDASVPCTPGHVRYARLLQERYNLSCASLRLPSSLRSLACSGDQLPSNPCATALARCVAECPITLQPMHCPVIASDGYTYELSALLKILRLREPRSPMTREPLQPWGVYNRQAVHMETEVVHTGTTLEERRRRHVRLEKE